ncbi:MAG: hypothetical protein M3331_01230 [Actinomycetota bacterium]|nr:hypothetical protein [Actinomycetota bacterium]
MKRLTPAAVLAAIASLGLAPGASAHELSLDRAKARTLLVSEGLCSQREGCVKYEARYCDRASNHKLACIASMVVRQDDGERVVCRTRVVVTLPSDGRKLNTELGTTRCR